MCSTGLETGRRPVLFNMFVVYLHMNVPIFVFINVLFKFLGKLRKQGHIWKRGPRVFFLYFMTAITYVTLL